MKRLIFFILLLSNYLHIYGQCPNVDYTGNPEYINVPNKPSSTTIQDMIGLTCGREWDGIYLNNRQDEVDFTKVGSFVRIFHEMQRDYATQAGTAADPNGVNTPRNHPEGPIVNASPNNWSQFYGMNDNYQSFRYWYAHFKESLGESFNGFMFSLTTAPFGQRSFPVGWYTNDELGGGSDPFNPDVEQIKYNMRNYAIAFAKTYCPKADDPDCPDFENGNCDCMIDVLEVGNEPWGYVNGNTYFAVLEGIINGLDEYYGGTNWPFRLAPGAFQAAEEDVPENDPMPAVSWVKESWRDYMGTRIPCHLKDRLDGVNVHPYSFDHNGFTLSAYPEKTGLEGVDDGSEMQRIKNAVMWCESNIPGTDIFVTEYGWDSRIVGNTAQSRYLMRSSLIFARMGVNRAAFYEGLDSNDGVTGDPGKMGLFESCGIWETGPQDRTAQPGGQKEAYFALVKMRELLGDKVFLHSIVEEDKGAYAYIFGNPDGTPTHLVSWLAKESDAAPEQHSFTLPGNFSMQMGRVSRWLDGDLSNGGTGLGLDPELAGGTSGNITINLHTTPLVIPLNNPGNCIYTADGTLSCGVNPCENDNLAPSISNCPSNIALTTTGSEQVANWLSPTATDNCMLTPTMTATHNSGDSFPLGSTTVTYTATDDSGNAATCSFSVTVTQDAGDDDDDDQDDDDEDTDDDDDEQDDDSDDDDTGDDSEYGINCPADMVLTADASGTAVVSFAMPTFFSDCLPPASANCTGEDIAGYVYLGAHENNDYYLSTTNKGWNKARNNCESMDGHLAVIGDDSENEFIRQQIQSNGITTAFIGLSDKAEENHFEWVNDDDMTFEHFSGSPNSSTMDYVYISSWTDGQWYLANNITAKRYVCELPCEAADDDNNGPVLTRTDNGLANNSAWPVGQYTVSYEMTDDCGNIATCSFNITITAGADDCDNITDAGTIFGEENSCEAFDPTKIEHISDPLGGSGSLTYQWEYSTIGAAGPWSAIPGATGTEYDPTEVTETTWYRRGVRRDGCTDWVYSNIVAKVVEEDCDGDTNCTGGADMPGFVYLGSYNNSEYYLSTSNYFWMMAMEEATSMGGHMVAVNDADENEFLRQAMNQNGVVTAFIGLSDYQSEGTFSWMNGEELDYTNWGGIGSSGTGNTDYIYMGSWTTGPWYLAGQWVAKPFICEIHCEDNSDFVQPFVQNENQDESLNGENELNEANEEVTDSDSERRNGMNNRTSEVQLTYSLYPNPVQNTFTLDMKEQKFSKLSVYDVNGVKKFEKVLDYAMSNLSVDVSFLSDGIYFLIIEGEEFDSTQHRFVKISK